MAEAVLPLPDDVEALKALVISTTRRANEAEAELGGRQGLSLGQRSLDRALQIASRQAQARAVRPLCIIRTQIHGSGLSS
jgi:hypothetical protein